VLRRTSDDAELFFATTHFDNNSPSQELSAPLVLERTPPAAAGRPIVLVGDFNSRPDSTAYATLMNAEEFHFDDAFALAPDWTMETNQAPAPAYDTTDRIDHVLLAGTAWQVERWIVDTWIYGPNDRYVSDHFAIAADLVAP
jgi:endonuclease/exonuclease/phosphatase family metal-dependent hydrolase